MAGIFYYVQGRLFKVKLMILTLVLLGAYNVQGQCPLPATCTPGNIPASNVVFGMGILNVNINNGAINNTTAAVTASTGYVDYSCVFGTSLLASSNYPISVQTNPNTPENVRVWIDYDNNGTFNTTSELAFSSTNKTLHTGSLTIPATAITNVPLRMRVAADNFTAPQPTPCGTSQYSQVEDYRITVFPNTNPAAPLFTANKPVTCSPTVTFQDQSLNNPTSWSWNFGDPASGTANTSTLQNPTHSFSGLGNYTVTLTVCNANGCNTLVKPNFINYHNSVPVAASCSPNTSSYCCNYGITDVNIGNGLLVNSSANGTAGYEDFTCTKSLNVVVGAPYAISLTTGINAQDARVYIDLNNDGAFTGANEVVAQFLNRVNPTGTITIPSGAVLNTPLRLRVISDYTGSPFTSCGNIQNGQAEDYTIIVSPNNSLPVANFKTDSTNTCSGIVPFQDISSFGPTSWNWNFGDPASGVANTSTLQNPTHTFTAVANGKYTVTLIACNSLGCDTITKTNYINFDSYCKSYCVSNGHNNSNRWISNVSFGTINNTSGQNPNGYGNYTHIITNMPIGSINNPLKVTLGGNVGPVNVWIDFNKDGVFQPSEKVVSKGAGLQNGIISATENVAIPRDVTPGLTRMRVFQSFQLQNDPCITGTSNGETEDYYINFVPNTLPVKSQFTANQDSICTGLVKFFDNSINLPDSWLWNFGDGTTSTLQNPTHSYTTAGAGTYTVSLTACKAGLCDTKVINGLIYITVPCTNYCNVAGTAGNNYRITNVTVGSINNSTTTISPGGYGDFRHLSTDLIIGSKKNPISLSTSNGAELQLWIDFNHDRVFQPNERLYYDNYSSPINLDSIDVPATALPGPTRMRVSLGGYQTVNTPCSNIGFFETEDYTIVLKYDQDLPVVDFTGTPLVSCNGQASFSVKSNNTFLTYNWDFGDQASGSNNTSNLPNPTHTFSGLGVYNITMTACNNAGCTSVVKSNYINYDPTSINCRSVNLPTNQTPLTTTYCTGLLFDSGGPTGNYGSGNNLTSVVISPPGSSAVSLSFTSFDLDLGDQVFVYDGRSTTAPVIGIYGGNTLPNNGNPIISTYGPLTVALRRGSNGGSAPGFAANWSCTPISASPVPNFVSKPGNTFCNSQIEFFDRSTNMPTSWNWNFGDPTSTIYNTSTLQNPTHSFGPTGNYVITLTTCNALGCNTTTRNFYAGYLANNTAPKSSNCQVVNNQTCCGFGISRVSLNKVNYSSPIAAFNNGFEDFSCQIKDTVQAGSVYTLTVVNNLTGANENVKAWIDYNDNGDFDANELIVNSLNKKTHTAPVTISTSAILNKPLRMRVISDEAAKTIANGCYLPEKGQIEDYAIYIVTTMPNGISELWAKTELEGYPNPTTGKVNLRLTNKSLDDFQLTVNNVLGKVVQERNVRLGGEQEVQLDLTGMSRGVYFVRISNSTYSVVKKIIVE